MKCRLCGNQNLSLYYSQGNTGQYKFYKCDICKLVNYDMSGGQDQKKYSPEKYINPEDESLKTNADQKAAYNFIRGKIKDRGRLLDIGCGNGKLLSLAKKDKWDVAGLELSRFLAESINKRYGIKVITSDFLEYIPDPGSLFNVVVLRHVLEHLPDSIAAMKKINSLLNAGGFAVLEFPDIEGYGQKLKRFLSKIGLRKKKYNPEYRPGHCNEFCKESFEYLLDKTGFKMLDWRHYSSRSFLNSVYRIAGFGTKARALIKKISQNVV
jgi:SAM-dependent methyltransferase